MATGRPRDPRREAYWRDVLKRQRSSGLSVRAFCLHERLTQRAFYRWGGAIRKRDRERMRQASVQTTPPAPTFVPVLLQSRQHSPGVAEECIQLELRHGRILRLPLSMPAGKLAALVHALESQPQTTQEGT